MNERMRISPTSQKLMTQLSSFQNWIDSTLTQTFKNMDSNQLMTQPKFTNMDSNQLMAQAKTISS